MTGLQPDTEYTYKVFVKGAGMGRRASAGTGPPLSKALVQAGGRYDNRFRTHPESADAIAV